MIAQGAHVQDPEPCQELERLNSDSQLRKACGMRGGMGIGLRWCAVHGALGREPHGSTVHRAPSPRHVSSLHETKLSNTAL